MVQVPLLTWEIMVALVFLLLGLVLGIWRTNRLWFKCFVTPELKKLEKSPPHLSIKLPKFKSIIKTVFRCVIIILAGFGALTLVLLIIF